MSTNEGRKSKDRSRSKTSEQSQGNEEQLRSQAKAQQDAGARDAARLHLSVASPTPAARAAEASAVPRGETELPVKGGPTPLEATRPRGRLLDAWHATYSSPLTIALLKSRAALVERALKFVSFPDDRQRVMNTTDFPFRCICFLITTAADGTSWGGTGWFASPRLIVTAGHMVFLPLHGGWATQIEVFPGNNGRDAPFGSFVSTDFRSVRGWTEAPNPDTPDAHASDYGAILLPESSPVGFFGYASLSDEELQDVQVNVFGYPGDRANPGEDPPPPGVQGEGELWGNARLLSLIGPTQLFYKVSTSGGESGCPVFIKEGVHRTVVGVHNYGGASRNFATRITDDVFSNIEDWKAEVS